MGNELINQLKFQKESFICLALQSMENVDEKKLRDDFEKCLMELQNILNKFNDEKSTTTLVEILNEIRAKYRYRLIKLCQEKSLLLNQFGLENIDCLDVDELKPIVMIRELIDMCKYEIKSINNPDNEVVEDENALYIFMDSTIDDIDSYPDEFASDFSDIIDRMYSGKHIGKENRCKVMKNSNLENSLEYRGNHGTRLYENQVKTDNAKVNKIIRNLEKKLGKKIHYIYKIEVKKCTSTNGLDKRRNQRYKNEKDRITELLIGMSSSEVLEYAKVQKDKIKEVLKIKDNSTNDERKYRIQGFYILNDIINAGYNMKIFDGESDPIISEVELETEEAIEVERKNIFTRLIENMKTFDFDQLQILESIFDWPKSDFSMAHFPKDCPKTQRDIVIENEKNRIILQIAYAMRNMTIDELMKIEMKVIILLNFKDDYKYIYKKGGVQHGHI